MLHLNFTSTYTRQIFRRRHHHNFWSRDRRRDHRNRPSWETECPSGTVTPETVDAAVEAAEAAAAAAAAGSSEASTAGENDKEEANDSNSVQGGSGSTDTDL